MSEQSQGFDERSLPGLVMNCVATAMRHVDQVKAALSDIQAMQESNDPLWHLGVITAGKAMRSDLRSAIWLLELAREETTAGLMSRGVCESNI